MTTTSVGAGIEAAPESVQEDPPAEPMHIPDLNIEGIADANLNAFRALIHEEMAAYVADAERRLAQAREIENAIITGAPRQVHAEDLNIGKHLVDGYNLTANSPVAGSIAWANLHIVYLGVDYTITDGNTALKYAWFVKPGSGTSATLSTSNTLPTLGANDALIFINNSGTPISVLESSVVYAVGPGAIGNAQLDSTTQTLLTNLQNNDVTLQAAIDGQIVSYFQSAAPWPTGTAHNGDTNMGDIWYDSDPGGGAYRWSGATGTPANTWVKIADTDTSGLTSLINTKVTTYLANASPGPTAPSGGFTTGDMWMVIDQGNKLRRWSGSAWVDVLIGDGAIASGISGAKIGSGIDAGNVTTGTLSATRVGTGVNGAVLSTATGTVSSTQIATGAVTPVKINAAFHILY